MKARETEVRKWRWVYRTGRSGAEHEPETKSLRQRGDAKLQRNLPVRLLGRGEGACRLRNAERGNGEILRPRRKFYNRERRHTALGHQTPVDFWGQLN